jgi:hypothetical protein
MTRLSYNPFSMRFVALALSLVVLVLTIGWCVDAFAGSDRPLGEVVVYWMLGAFGYGVVWRYMSGLADEVWDAGDHLIVRVGSTSARVPISDIESVIESTFTHRGRITLRLWRPGPFGSVIAFIAMRDVQTDQIPLVKSLMERVERLQRTAS